MSMKERPILFSGPMVRAILEGRKTQTRRIVKFTEFGVSDTPGYQWHFRGTRKGGKGGLWQDMRHEQILNLCPYGVAGDWLWVREAWAVVPHVTDNGPKHRAKGDGTGVTWRADWNANPSGFKWKPSIHMPRWASRISLEIVSVRVERLQDISEPDAIAEGIQPSSNAVYWMDYSTGIANVCKPQFSYMTLWESINGPKSWTDNPWVWCVSFRRIINAS